MSGAGGPLAAAGRRCRRWPGGARDARSCVGDPGRRTLAAPSARATAAGGEEGYAPSTRERRRLAAVGAVAALLGGWFLAGAAAAVPLSIAGPGIAGWAVSSRRRRYRRAVERALPEVAAAVADLLAAGRSLRFSLPASASSVDGPAAVELAQLGAELELGAPTVEAIEGWRRRMRSARVDAFAAALLSQRRAGGDLAGLLRRFADGAAERDRAADDAKAATAQARFTGLLVVAMPSGGALFAELIQPGFLVKVLAAPGSAVLLALAAALQVAGFVAIRRLAQVVE